MVMNAVTELEKANGTSNMKNVILDRLAMLTMLM
jgi:hypothetical protein